ncbi:tetratricopeptide repeat protein [Flavobacteriaceae bacterium R38]|nr:tetratricopeptide repeat protein [Flavobacteriaceae bacterium R38]
MNSTKVSPSKTLFFLLIFFSFNILNAQEEKDTLQAWEYYQKADSLFEKEDFKSAIPKFKKAISIYEKAEAWKQAARSYNKITRNYYKLIDVKNGLENANKALKISNTKLPVPNREQAYAYLNLGNYYLGIASLKEAISNYEKSLSIIKEVFSENHPNVVIILNQIGEAYLQLNDFDKALSTIEKAISIGDKNYEIHKKNIGKSYEIYGAIHYTNRNLTLAKKAFNRALEIQLKEYGKDHLNTSAIYNSLGQASYENQEFDEALDYYIKSLKIKETILEKDHLNILKNTENIALIYYIKEEYQKALDYFNKVLEIKLKKYEKGNVNLAYTYNYLGFVYNAIGDYPKALDFSKKSLAIFKKVYSENHSIVIHGYVILSNIYVMLKEYKKALFYAKEAARVDYNLYKDNSKDIYGIYTVIGSVYFELKDYDAAIKNYQIVLENRIKLYGEKHPLISEILNRIGSVFQEKGEYKKALVYYKKAIGILNENKDEKNKQIKLYQIGNGDYLSLALIYMANTHLQLYLRDNNITDLNESIETYKKAEKQIDTLKQIFTRYEDRLEFSKIGEEVYPGSIRANYLLNTKKENIDALKQAFYYSEKNHANVLEENLIASNTQNFSGLPGSLIELENTLKNRRAHYQSQITNELDKKEVDSTALASFEDQLFEINRRYDSLTDVLKKDYPKYHQLKYDHAVISVSQVQQKLDDKTTLLEYFTADSLTYAFVISKNKFDVKELSTDSLLAKVEQQRKALSQKDLVSYKKMSRTLYQELISPIADLLVGEHLIIVPDGPLWHLNFDLLLSKDTDSRNPQQLPYLLNTYAISYANSANLLFNRPDFNNVDVLNQALAFSYADTTALADGNVMRLGALRDAGEDLPGTRKEIKAISDIVDGVYYYGKEAIEANFKKDADRYGIVHLALHGEVDNENPQNSKLFFTKSNDTIEDNLLYSHELFALHVPAELTVLSACNTGTGKIAKGEGIMSLGNAFQYAGTKSLLLSSWEVADDTAPELMKYFYANLKEGMSKPKALQQAKLEYLKTVDPARSNPFYWGNFYIVGDPKPISLDSNFSYWYWILGAIALVGIGGGMYYRKRAA